MFKIFGGDLPLVFILHYIKDRVRWERNVLGTESDEGGLGKKYLLKPKIPRTAKLEQFGCFKHKIEFFNAVFSKKVVKLERKMSTWVVLC